MASANPIVRESECPRCGNPAPWRLTLGGTSPKSKLYRACNGRRPNGGQCLYREYLGRADTDETLEKWGHGQNDQDQLDIEDFTEAGAGDDPGARSAGPGDGIGEYRDDDSGDDPGDDPGEPEPVAEPEREPERGGFFGRLFG